MAGGSSDASRAGRLYVGTSGYSYDEWRGTFYPESSASDDYLRFYSSRFDTVEINHSFYRFPTPPYLDEWASQTPPDFVFAMKANQRITHKKRLKDVADTTTQFVERVQMLGDRLGPVLFQLPPQFARNDARLDTFLATIPTSARPAIEFRHRSWFDDSVFERLAARNVAMVVTEDDKFSSPRRLTADFTYVRLRKESYDDAALAEWRVWMRECSTSGVDVFAYFKHDDAGTSPAPLVAALVG